MSDKVQRKRLCDDDIKFVIRSIVRETDSLERGFLMHLRLRSRLRHNTKTQQDNVEQRPAGGYCESNS
ncbi:MAG: hypothetical protein ACPG32_02555 [Akkermansiaceae bacterium]